MMKIRYGNSYHCKLIVTDRFVFLRQRKDTRFQLFRKLGRSTIVILGEGAVTWTGTPGRKSTAAYPTLAIWPSMTTT